MWHNCDMFEWDWRISHTNMRHWQKHVIANILTLEFHHKVFISHTYFTRRQFVVQVWSWSLFTLNLDGDRHREANVQMLGWSLWCKQGLALPDVTRDYIFVCAWCSSHVQRHCPYCRPDVEKRSSADWCNLHNSSKIPLCSHSVTEAFPQQLAIDIMKRWNTTVATLLCRSTYTW